jgi:hypothetical protein
MGLVGATLVTLTRYGPAALFCHLLDRATKTDRQAYDLLEKRLCVCSALRRRSRSRYQYSGWAAAIALSGGCTRLKEVRST